MSRYLSRPFPCAHSVRRGLSLYSPLFAVLNGLLRAYYSSLWIFATQNTRKLSLILRVHTAASSKCPETAPTPTLICKAMISSLVLYKSPCMVVHTPGVGLVATNGNEAAAHVPQTEKNTQLKKKRSTYIPVESPTFLSTHSNIKNTFQFHQHFRTKSELSPYQKLITSCTTTKSSYQHAHFKPRRRLDSRLHDPCFGWEDGACSSTSSPDRCNINICRPWHCIWRCSRPQGHPSTHRRYGRFLR